MAGKDIKAGKLFGIEIRLDYSWLIIVGLIAWTFISSVLPASYPSLSTLSVVVVGLISTVLFFSSLLTHELAHSLYARKHGVPVKRIRLFIFGGASEIEGEAKTPQVEIIMAILGPLTSMALGVMFAFVAVAGIALGNDEITALGSLLCSINFMLGFFNLIPAFPLDGGRVLMGIVWKATGNVNRATHVAAKSGKAFSYILIAGGVLEVIVTQSVGGIWLMLIGSFLNATSSAALRESEAKLILGKAPVSQLMEERFTTVSPHITIKEFLKDFVLKYKTTTFIVMNNNEIVGTINAGDVKKAHESEAVEKYTCRDPCVVEMNEKVSDCFEKMATSPLAAVVNNGTLVGVISPDDMRSYILGKRAWIEMGHKET